MLRQVPFLVFYILLWFACVNGVESLSTSQEQCLEFDIADLEEYVSTLNLANVPTVDTMFAGFEYPITTFPFGFLRSDWARLLLLRKVITEESIFAKKFERLIRILIIAYQKVERGLVPNGYLNETNNGNSVITERVISDTTMVARTVGIVNISNEDIKEMEKSNARNKQENVERVTTKFNTNTTDLTTNSTENFLSEKSTITECLDNEVESFSTLCVHKLSEQKNITSKITENWIYENRDEKIIKEEKNEKDPITSWTSSTPINFEAASVVNSKSTVKLNRFGTFTEKFNSIDSLSTVRIGISEEMVSQEEETERSTSHTINFHDSDNGGNRNIEGDRDFAFTTLSVGSSMNTVASANGRTDFNSSDIDRKNIKNDEKLKVSPSTVVDTVTLLSEKSDKFDVTVLDNLFVKPSTSSENNSHSLKEKVTNNESSDTLRSTNSYANTILSTSSENILSVNQDFVSSTKASTNSGSTRSTLSDVTNRQNLQETTLNEVSISEKDNPDNTSSVVRNSMDYLDPSWNSVHDIFSHESDKFNSDIDGSKRMIGNKLKKLLVFRKQPPGTFINDYEEIMQRHFSDSSKVITLPTNSIEDTNGFKETPLGSRKRSNTNINIENNFRFFYNLGERSAARKKARDDLDFIRIKCKDEST